MKMIMISYNEAVEEEVMEAMSHCEANNYTKIMNVYGKGEASGTHLGNDIWPGKNNVLFIACEDKKAKQLLSCIRELRQIIGKEGIKAFMMPIEEIT